MAQGIRTQFHSKRHTRRVFWRRVTYGGTTFVVLASLLVAIFFGTRLSLVTVDDTIVRGVETVPEDDVRAHANSLLAGAYFGLVPHRFSFAVPEDRIKASVEAIPRISRAEVRREGKNLVVEVHEHTPSMLWCADINEESDCYYIDDRGVAYEKAPQLTGTSLLRFTVASSAPQENATLLDATTRTFLKEMTSAVEAKYGFHVVRIAYTLEGDAVLHLARGGAIIVSTHEEKDALLATLNSILTSKEYAPLTRKNFEYIDLRFGNKVFIQKEKPIATTTATTTTTVE